MGLLQGVENNDITRDALVFIDTSDCDLYELDLPDEQSKGNEGQITPVCLPLGGVVSLGCKH